MRFTHEHETVVVIGGQEYHAQTAKNGLCNGCAFYDDWEAPGCPGENAAPCTRAARADREYIIWVRA